MMEHSEFLSAPENRDLARSVSMQAAGDLAPSEARVNKRFVDPLLDMVAKGETISPKATESAMGLGGGELALMLVVPIVVQVLVQFLQKLGENHVGDVMTRLEREPIEVFPIVQVASVACSEKEAPEWVNPARLRQVLTEYFNSDELQSLCFDLGIDYESLPGEGKANKAREVVGYARRRGQIPELYAEIKKSRPHVSWEEAADPAGAFAAFLQDVPAEGVLVVYISMQDIQRFVSNARFTRVQRNFQELARAINVALQNHLVSEYGKQN
jgi:hypothetical protein